MIPDCSNHSYIILVATYEGISGKQGPHWDGQGGRVSLSLRTRVDPARQRGQATGLPQVQEPALGSSEARTKAAGTPVMRRLSSTPPSCEDCAPTRAPLDLSRPVRVFDFFCGCGGASAGLRAAGMEIALGLDNDPDARRTFEANFPRAKFLADDIRAVPASALDDAVREQAGSPLLFNACAPCQPFSRQHRGPPREQDERVALLDHFLRFVRRHSPELVLAENVPGLRDGDVGGEVFERLVLSLRSLGYSTTHRVVRSQDYGVPQRRSRLVLLASVFGPVPFPEPTHGTGTPHAEFATVGDWIGTLPAIAAGETHRSDPNHRAARLSQLNLRRIRATPPGGGWPDLPPELMPASRRSGFSGFTDVYGRLKWDAPAPALTTRCISYSNGRFGHPHQDRAISVREAACLQTFSRDFVFAGNLNSQARQVGNAVPALLAQRFGECITRHLAGIVGDAAEVSAGVQA